MLGRPDAYPDPDADGNADTDAHTYADGNADADTNADANANTHPDAYAGSVYADADGDRGNAWQFIGIYVDNGRVRFGHGRSGKRWPWPNELHARQCQ